MSKIKMILAIDLEGGIGKSGTIPWHLPEDLKIFKQKTAGCYVVMGSNTWNDDMLPKPLNHRTPIVLSRNPRSLKAINHIHQIIGLNDKDLKDKVKSLKGKDVFICGGSVIYELLFDIVDEIHVTIIKDVYDCDKFFDMTKVYDKFTTCEGDAMDFDDFYHLVYKRK